MILAENLVCKESRVVIHHIDAPWFRRKDKFGRTPIVVLSMVGVERHWHTLLRHLDNDELPPNSMIVGMLRYIFAVAHR